MGEAGGGGLRGGETTESSSALAWNSPGLSKKDVLLIIGDWNGRVGSQESTLLPVLQLLGVTGKFGLGVRNEAGQRLTVFCQENALVLANTHFQQHKR